MEMIKGELFFFYYLRNKLLDLRSRKNSVIAGAVMSSFPIHESFTVFPEHALLTLRLSGRRVTD